MKKVFKKSIISLSIFATFSCSHALAQTLEVLPDPVLQGEPVMIHLQDVNSLSSIVTMTLDGRTLYPFLYKSSIHAFIGTDLQEKVGSHFLKVLLKNGKILEQTITVNKRETLKAPLGIPDKLGGNTVTSQNNLISALTKENNLLASLATNKKTLWTKPFTSALLHPIVVDPYGYERLTGEYTIAHKGTDYRAPVGTNVYAMNRGVVRLVRTSPVYGKMVVIDHGQGLMTFYMHLSKIQVKQGTVVEQGAIIGKSGQTGYALSPHLHVTVRIQNVSIDPEKFLALFQ
jgi:hypothetical protein